MWGALNSVGTVKWAAMKIMKGTGPGLPPRVESGTGRVVIYDSALLQLIKLTARSELSGETYCKATLKYSNTRR